MLNKRVTGTDYRVFTCVAIAKAGPVPSVCQSVRKSFGCQVCVNCNSNMPQGRLVLPIGSHSLNKEHLLT